MIDKTQHKYVLSNRERCEVEKVKQTPSCFLGMTKEFKHFRSDDLPGSKPLVSTTGVGITGVYMCGDLFDPTQVNPSVWETSA
ncbi:hypothetical protein PGT21_003759 [Puccinia graminis f. sp. tritici]|uniref:Uncharacterized protein n=1 Tax=Puccinia graminis f. sp. tritici TaxID=56615 RepID=A0A5B0MI53_PUCGR|nr:hypothetical protein PGT21_003759 [Puccinia graminis f. sp. tritici]KAA1135598.1 hypothetical protein PGTUg99_024871 [Puccinia graminis f. sp. tritici]